MGKEADELTAIFTASGKTARQNNPKSSRLRNADLGLRNKKIRNRQSEI
jgi:hypothetical protein